MLQKSTLRLVSPDARGWPHTAMADTTMQRTQELILSHQLFQPDIAVCEWLVQRGLQCRVRGYVVASQHSPPAACKLSHNHPHSDKSEHRLQVRRRLLLRAHPPKAATTSNGKDVATIATSS